MNPDFAQELSALRRLVQAESRSLIGRLARGSALTRRRDSLKQSATHTRSLALDTNAAALQVQANRLDEVAAALAGNSRQRLDQNTLILVRAAARFFFILGSWSVIPSCGTAIFASPSFRSESPAAQGPSEFPPYGIAFAALYGIALTCLAVAAIAAVVLLRHTRLSDVVSRPSTREDLLLDLWNDLLWKLVLAAAMPIVLLLVIDIDSLEDVDGLCCVVPVYWYVASAAAMLLVWVAHLVHIRHRTS